MNMDRLVDDDNNNDIKCTLTLDSLVIAILHTTYHLLLNVLLTYLPSSTNIMCTFQHICESRHHVVYGFMRTYFHPQYIKQNCIIFRLTSSYIKHIFPSE